MNSDLVALEIMDIIDVINDDAYSAEEGCRLGSEKLLDLVRRLIKNEVVPYAAV